MMKKTTKSVSALILLIFLGVPFRYGFSCSTFLLDKGGNLIVGHNLDQEFYTPGSIFINPRGINRKSISREDLGLATLNTPSLSWKSRYGSLTFSILGIGLPDGGINEVGLVINEMALGHSQFPLDPEKPTMMIHQWIQYQLDNFSSVEEVLVHLNDINIDPSATFTPVSWANYHFFIADQSGKRAVIEFLEGKAVVFTGEDLIVPVLCNLPYALEMRYYDRSTGLLGWLSRWLSSGADQRFLIAAEELTRFETTRQSDPVSFCFGLLTRLQFESTRQWSAAYDILRRRVYFRTVGSPGIKNLNLETIDFSRDSSPRILSDLDTCSSVDLPLTFAPLEPSLNSVVFEKFFRSLVQFVSKKQTDQEFDDYLLKAHGLSLASFIERANKLSKKATPDRVLP